MFFFFFKRYGDHRDLHVLTHPFPTRRSSDRILKPAGSATGPGGGDFRHYNRHWTPVHPDFSVADLGDAIARARAAGAVQEGETLDLPYGRQAMRSEEHTSELQSLMRISYAVFCLKKKKDTATYKTQS